MPNFEFITVGVDSREQKRLARAHAAKKRHTRREHDRVVNDDDIQMRLGQGTFHAQRHTQASQRRSITSTRSPSLVRSNRDAGPAEEVDPATYFRNLSPIFGALSTMAALPFDPNSPDARYMHYYFTFYAPQEMAPEDVQIRWEMCCGHAVVFHGFQYLSAVHLGILRGNVPQADRRRMLFHKAETMRLLRDMISNLEQQDLKVVLMAVITLLYDIADKEHAPQRKYILPFTSHTPSACWISVYGRAVVTTEHFPAIIALLQKAGGLYSLSSHLTRSLRLSSLVAASAAGSQPVLPFSGILDESSIDSLRAQTLLPDATFGEGFAPHVPDSVLHTFTRICLLDRLVLAHRNIRYGQPGWHWARMGPILLAKNQAQHQLLSLPDWQAFSEHDTVSLSAAAYECCRLTAILYSTAILFPMPGETGWHVQQVARARRLFERSDLLEASGDGARPVIWSLYICGIAAFRTTHRRYLENQLRVLLTRLRLTKWTDVKEILESFLWTDSGCEHGGAVLWDSLGLEGDHLVELSYEQRPGVSELTLL